MLCKSSVLPKLSPLECVGMYISFIFFLDVYFPYPLQPGLATLLGRGMIDKLMKEAAEESDAKAFCDVEIEKSRTKQKELSARSRARILSLLDVKPLGLTKMLLSTYRVHVYLEPLRRPLTL